MLKKNPLKFIITILLGMACLTGAYFYTASLIDDKAMAAKRTEAFYGAAGAQIDSSLTVEEVLKYGLEEEYLSQAEYGIVIEQYGSEALEPFSSILQHDRHNIALLEELCKQYNVSVNQEDANAHIIYPSSIEQSYKEAIQLQTNTISMYERFLDQELPENVKTTIKALKDQAQQDLLLFNS